MNARLSAGQRRTFDTPATRPFPFPRRAAGQLGVVLGVLILCGLSLPVAARGAEIARLQSDNWDEYAPRGKEVDCIYGDYVLRNDRLTAVIAQPLASRNANMTVRQVGGCVIDLTTVAHQSDQLGAYYPAGRLREWRRLSVQVTPADDQQESAIRRGERIQVECRDEGSADRPQATVRYTLADGWDYLLVETTLVNAGETPLTLTVADEMRADVSFEKTPDGPAPLFWAYDKWFNQAYGLLPVGAALDCKSDGRNSTLKLVDGAQAEIALSPGASHEATRRLFPAADLLRLKALAATFQEVEQEARTVEARDSAGHPLAGALVTVTGTGQPYASGRTDARGELAFSLPKGDYEVTVEAVGSGRLTAPLAGAETLLELPQAGFVAARVTDERGGPIPCKVEFKGRDGTENPNFGHASGDRGVQNLVYSENGTFRQALLPGKYDVIASHGPEHDAVFAQLTVAEGQDTDLRAVLVRSVQTPGWISADFHSHSSPSGDNTSSQFGRVLNLLCEHIEFAPCTEHNRLSTYDPHLERLGARHLLATCVGIELTDSPGDVNHQNAFPLLMHAHTQDNGAPLSDADVELKIERLALWDNGSEKLVQQNHPDIGHLFFDRDANGEPDGGFDKALPFMDVIEVHPPHWILLGPQVGAGKDRNNTIFNWLQLLNQGHRLPGVVNTDAHYNFHGSGFLRIYLESPTDDPAQVQTLDMVHAAEHGHVIMTSGPYLEVLLSAGAEQGAPGDDVASPDGKANLRVRVQCPNWFDIDRVQVFLNGRPDESLNFNRGATPERFSGGPVKFDQEMALSLEADTHVIVVAAGENSTLGPVMGPDHGKDMPIAVSNPIYVDVDGDGFKANGDTLGVPLPVMSGRRK